MTTHVLGPCPRCQVVAHRRTSGYCQPCSNEMVKAWRMANPDKWRNHRRTANDRARIRSRMDIAKKWADALRAANGECLFCSQLGHADDCPAALFLRHIDELTTIWEG